ncbi:MAG: response regulator, partial [Thermoanaerobaculia bacterium]
MPNVINKTSPIADTDYNVACWNCNVQFNASAASWCACDRPLRTIVCPRCQTCFCVAPLPFKTRFWSDAPRAMREHKSRFRISHLATPHHAENVPIRSTAFRPPRVLVVDDDEPVRSLVACYVEQLGYTVTTAENALDALEILESNGFEVILTDALMPKMDGRELCRIVKQTHTSTVKTIVMTSLYKAIRFKSEAQLHFGVDEYLTKPLKLNDLQAVLSRVAPNRSRPPFAP